MKAIRNFDDAQVKAGRKPEGFQQKEVAELKPKGRIFYGWKRYEEAEEEE